VQTNFLAPVAATVRGAYKIYSNGVRALDPIDLELRQGEFITVLGPSGCGKSTLLRLIAGLAPASGGTSEVSENFRGERLDYVFQSPTLMPWASVATNVGLPLALSGTPRQAADEKVSRALALVDLSEFAGALPRELSGGMQMRTSIARALVTEPRLLLLDEPFGALDEITRHRLDREISALCARENLTVLFVTHSIYEAVFLSSRVLVMSPRPGRLHAEITIHAPRPRTDNFRSTPEFTAHCTQLSEMLASVMGEAAP
jgi:NitT/TauT family transport system ATP-binding protein